ncbi:MAG: histidinol-phosphatase [Proteobacteria bacterium]|nr:histidinol-phosphatase [Pseudomonadota bacterium]
MKKQVKPESLIPFAEQLATISGEIVRKYYRKSFTVEHKTDSTPVTLADKEIEQNIRAYIHNMYPEHGIIGEEFEPTNPDAEYKWIIDPIDGTKAFMMGKPIFGTLLSLVQGSTPILGIIDQPILGERWTGVQGFATNFNYDPIRTRLCSDISLAMLSTTSPNMFKDMDFESFERVRRKVRYTGYGGDCYAYGLLASGFVDIIVETDLKPHDFCALAPIIRGAHGYFTDWQGNPINLHSDGRVVACGDKRVHEQVLELLNA